MLVHCNTAKERPKRRLVRWVVGGSSCNICKHVIRSGRDADNGRRPGKVIDSCNSTDFSKRNAAHWGTEADAIGKPRNTRPCRNGEIARAGNSPRPTTRSRSIGVASDATAPADADDLRLDQIA